MAYILQISVIVKSILHSLLKHFLIARHFTPFSSQILTASSGCFQQCVASVLHIQKREYKNTYIKKRKEKGEKKRKYKIFHFWQCQTMHLFAIPILGVGSSGIRPAVANMEKSHSHFSRRIFFMNGC